MEENATTVVLYLVNCSSRGGNDTSIEYWHEPLPLFETEEFQSVETTRYMPYALAKRVRVQIVPSN